METYVEKLYKQYLKLLDRQHFIEKDLDYSILEKHVSVLEKLNVVNTSLISIFDLYKKDHIYLSSKFHDVLGWDLKSAKEVGIEYINSRVHPDDFVKLLEVGNQYLDYAFNHVTAKEAQNYKVMTDYRVQNSKGKYVRVIEQQMLLELDKHDNMWLALSILDLNPDQNPDSEFCSRALNFKTGELFEFAQPHKNKFKLSKREKEILKLVAEGMASKEIADRLYISVNTVNTHRQRILEKLDVSNTAEAIKYAFNVGWL